MSKKILKYKIEIEDRPVLELPEGAEILTVQVQHGEPHVWALVDNSLPKKTRFFELYGTGHPVTDANRNYIGTFQISEGYLVFHLFELISIKPYKTEPTKINDLHLRRMYEIGYQTAKMGKTENVEEALQTVTSENGQ